MIADRPKLQTAFELKIDLPSKLQVSFALKIDLPKKLRWNLPAMKLLPARLPSLPHFKPDPLDSILQAQETLSELNVQLRWH